jgi:hypothetical protein
MKIRSEDYESSECRDHIVDDRAPLDEYTLYEIEHDRQLEVIRNFKKTISSEPEFCGIYNLSSFIILDIFQNSHTITFKNNCLTKTQEKMFNSLYYELFQEHPKELLINKIANRIIYNIYVN